MDLNPLNKITRLEKVLFEIKKVEQSNSDTETLIKILKEEFRLEGNNVKNSFTYGGDLQDIILNELDEYKTHKKKGLKGGSPNEAKNLRRAFKNIVESEIL